MDNPDRTLTESSEFAYKNVGYGLVSYEIGDDFMEYRDGKLFTECFDSMGMVWTPQGWCFDGGMGMKTYLVRKEDLTPEQLEEAYGDA